MPQPGYLPLGSSESEDDFDPQGSLKPNFVHDYVFTVAYLGVLVLTVISLSLFVFIWIFLPYQHPQPHSQVIRPPTTYASLRGMDTSHATPFPTIFSYAHITLQTKTVDKSRKTYEEDRMYQSRNGIIYPDDRHIVVNSEVSTIIQFRHLDYGMEKCILHLIVPEDTMKHHPNTRLNQSSVIDVWHLAVDGEISRYIPGTWYSAPQRGDSEVFTSFKLNKVGEELMSPEFYCRSGSYSTFELACHGGQIECLLDFWQVKDEPHNGFYISQADSL